MKAQIFALLTALAFACSNVSVKRGFAFSTPLTATFVSLAIHSVALWIAVALVGLSPLWSAPDVAERCARNMLQATIEFRSRARSIQRVVYCLWGKTCYDVFDRVLRDLEP